MSDEPSRRTCRIVDQREDRCCIICGVSLYTVDGARHHRKMRSQAERAVKHTVGNLILVCEECHNEIHAHPTFSYSQGWLVKSRQNPLDVPILTGAHGWALLDNEGHWKPYEPTKESK